MLKKKQVIPEWKPKRVKLHISKNIKSVIKKPIYFSCPHPKCDCPMQTNFSIFQHIPKDDNKNVNYNVKWDHLKDHLLIKQIIQHCCRDHGCVIPNACNTRVCDVSVINIPSEVDLFKLCKVNYYFKNDRNLYNILKYSCIDTENYENYFNFDKVKAPASKKWRNRYRKQARKEYAKYKNPKRHYKQYLDKITRVQ